MRSNQVIALVLTVLMLPAYSGAVDDQASLVSPSEIEEALAQSVAEQEAARESVRNVLRRDDLRAVAADFGIDSRALDVAVAAVDTLDDEELEVVTAHAAGLSDQLAGGQTVTISLVALLLIVIIVILLA